MIYYVWVDMISSVWTHGECFLTAITQWNHIKWEQSLSWLASVGDTVRKCLCHKLMRLASEHTLKAASRKGEPCFSGSRGRSSAEFANAHVFLCTSTTHFTTKCVPCTITHLSSTPQHEDFTCPYHLCLNTSCHCMLQFGSQGRQLTLRSSQ